MLIQFLSGAELTVEKVGKISLLTLRIDSSELFAKDDKIDYRAIFELFNSDGEVVSLIKKDIALSTTDIKNNNNIILFLEEELKVGNYSGFLKLNNNIRKDKKEEKFNFSVDKNQHFSKLYLIKNINDIKVEVTSWDEINEDSEAYLYQIYQEEVQNLKFICENSEVRKETDFYVTKKLNHKIDVKYLLDNFSNCYIEFTQNNQFYKHEVILEKKLIAFRGNILGMSNCLKLNIL